MRSPRADPVRARAVLPWFLFLVACGNEPTVPDAVVDWSREWTSASPAEVGADSAQVARAIGFARGADRLLNLLAVKDGRLVVEEHFGANRRESLRDVRSGTKSVASALPGIALEPGSPPLASRIGMRHRNPA